MSVTALEHVDCSRMTTKQLTDLVPPMSIVAYSSYKLASDATASSPNDAARCTGVIFHHPHGLDAIRPGD